MFCHMCLSLNSSQHGSGFPQSEGVRDTPDEDIALCNLIPDVTSPHLCRILIAGSQPLNAAHAQGEGVTQGCDCQKAGISRAILEDARHHAQVAMCAVATCSVLGYSDYLGSNPSPAAYSEQLELTGMGKKGFLIHRIIMGTWLNPLPAWLQKGQL